MAAEPTVLVVTPDYPPVPGGIQVLVHRLVGNLERWRPTVVTLDGAGAADFDRDGAVAVHRVPARPAARPAQIARLNAAALALAVRDRPRAVLSGHIVSAPAAAAIHRALGAPVVQYAYAQELRAKPRLARFALGRADRIVAISRYTADLVRAAGADERRIRIVAPGVDLPADARRAPRERPTILTVTRIGERYKGHDVMVRALALVRIAVPDVEWVVIGDGPLRPALEELVDAYGLARHVRFAGALDDAARDRWLSRAHCFAMPSRLPAGDFAGEGFGIVYLEAAAHGLPVVAGDAGGSLDAVVDGVTGLLVPAGDHLAVADALVALLTEPERAAAIGRAGAEHARRFSWSAMAAAVEQVLNEF